MRYTLFVKPGSKKGPLVETDDAGNLTVFVQERAIDGAANEAVVALLAKHFGVRRSQVTLESGFTGRHKRVRIE